MATRRYTSTAPVLRPLSPSGRFSTSHRQITSSQSAFASSTSTFSTFHRSTSPTRVSLYNSAPPPSSSSSVRFSFDRPTSPGRSITASSNRSHVVQKHSPGGTKKTCMCSPTNHPGSFRCSFHKNKDNKSAVPYQSNRLNAQRSAMTNSLVRIGTVEGDLVRRALAALIRPSSHQQKRRSSFQPRPSRLSSMSKAEIS